MGQRLLKISKIINIFQTNIFILKEPSVILKTLQPDYKQVHLSRYKESLASTKQFCGVSVDQTAL